MNESSNPPRINRTPSSFRDPAGYVFLGSNRVFRCISDRAAPYFDRFLHSSFFRKHAGTSIVNTREVSHEEVISAGVHADDARAFPMWVEHDSVPFISYPYEWSFESLKSAAGLTLDLLISGLNNGYILKDASAFNIQFVNSKPIFIDILSFQEHTDNTPFLGYKQFCEHFLAPLCLKSFSGIDFNPWFRGRLEGLDLIEVSSVLPVKSYFLLNVFLHIHMQAWAMRKIESSTQRERSKKPRNSIQKKNLIALAKGLKHCVNGLNRKKISYWEQYSRKHSYDEISNVYKMKIVQDFVKKNNLKKLLDIGCNTGEYSAVALSAGAQHIIGVDLDSGALDLATKKAQKNNLPALFLYYDVANPSPNLGWNHNERMTLKERLGEIDGVLCLALVHHMVITRNIILSEFVFWICGIAKKGLIEFIPKSDLMLKNLLYYREDIFYEYTQSNFEKNLESLCNKITRYPLPNSERIIYEYEK